MGRNKQPTKLIIAKGKKHLTKAEIKERESTELNATCDYVVLPDFLTTKKEKERFEEIASVLMELEIMSELDGDVLGRYIKSQEDWVTYGKLVRQTQTKLKRAIADDDAFQTKHYTELLTKYEGMRSKAFNQAQTCASCLGLTITSRCKIVVPKPPEVPEGNIFDEFKEGDKSVSG